MRSKLAASAISAALWFVTLERKLPAERRAGRDHRFVVIDRGDVDESHRFHANAQGRFVEDSIVQHRFHFLIADILCFHPGGDGDDSFIGPYYQGGKPFSSEP